MYVKVRKERFARAESFIVHLAAVMSGPSSTAGSRDVETSARKIADLLSARVAAGDLDSVLSVIDRTLIRETQAAREPRPPRGGRLTQTMALRARDIGSMRIQEIDPYFWG
jgi:hypothetical protein